MFGSKSREPTDVRARDSHLTGLERAKLERSLAPPVTTFSPAVRPVPVLPPQPVPQPTPQPTVVAPAPVQTAPPAVPQVRPVVRQPAPQTANKSQLIVGEGVGLKGDVFNCDMLRVDGTIEGNVKARKLMVSAVGTLVGTAQIAEADIEGRFEGTLTASGLLAIRGTGQVSGKIGYEHIAIDRGGQISGEIQAGKLVQKCPRPETAGTGSEIVALNPADTARLTPIRATGGAKP